MTTADMTTKSPGHPRVLELLPRVQAEYREMPCLSLTREQMQRLWGIESAECEVLIDALVAARIVRLTPRGTYVAVRTGH